MNFLGSFHEEDSLKDLSVELTVHREWLSRIRNQGNRPEDWVEFIHYLKGQSSVPVTSSWTAYICDQYVDALKTIPSSQNKNNIMFVKLLVDYATLKSEENIENGQSLFRQARSIARKFAIAHIYAAEFELKYDNPSKCRRILEKAQTFGSEPQHLLQKALDNLDSGKSYLLTDEEKAACFDASNQTLKPEEKPTVSSSGLAVGTVKNKFLASLATSNETVLSESKSRQVVTPEVAVKKDSSSSPEEFICGSIFALSEKWGSLNQSGPFAKRFSHLYDRRVSNVHAPLDKRLSSIQGSTDPCLSTQFTAFGSSHLGSSNTPDCHKSSLSAGSNENCSASKFLRVKKMPQRVKVEEAKIYDSSDEEEDSMNKFTPKMSSVFTGRSIQVQRLTATILEEEVTKGFDSSLEKTETKLSESPEDKDSISVLLPKFDFPLSCHNQDKPDSYSADIKLPMFCDNSHLVDRNVFGKTLSKESAVAKDDDDDKFVVPDRSAIIGVVKAKNINSQLCYLGEHQDKIYPDTPRPALSDSLLPCSQANISVSSLGHSGVGCTLDNTIKMIDPHSCDISVSKTLKDCSTDNEQPEVDTIPTKVNNHFNILDIFSVLRRKKEANKMLSLRPKESLQESLLTKDDCSKFVACSNDSCNAADSGKATSSQITYKHVLNSHDENNKENPIQYNHYLSKNVLEHLPKDQLAPCQSRMAGIQDQHQLSPPSSKHKPLQKCFQSQMSLEHLPTSENQLPVQHQLDFLKDTPKLSEQCPQPLPDKSQLKEINIQTPEYSNPENQRSVKEEHPSMEGNIPGGINTVATPHIKVAAPSTVNPVQSEKKLRSLVVNNKMYTILKKVGKGGSSIVYEVFDQSGNRMAVKCVAFGDTNEVTIQSYKNEVILLKRLQYSDQIIKLYDYELDCQKNCLNLVLEFGSIDLASLFRSQYKTEKIPQVMVMCYWAQMLEAVLVLHKEGIVHSDLKPANFLIVGGRLKLIDFGIADIIQTGKTGINREILMGTPDYMSPESIAVYLVNSKDHKIGLKSDIWSLGCILYCMVYGKTPFQEIRNTSKKLTAIRSDKFKIQFADVRKKELLDTMKCCLCRDPEDRPTIEEILQHPYLSEMTIAPTAVTPKKDDMEGNKLVDSKIFSAKSIKTSLQIADNKENIVVDMMNYKTKTKLAVCTGASKEI